MAIWMQIMLDTQLYTDKVMFVMGTFCVTYIHILGKF